MEDGVGHSPILGNGRVRVIRYTTVWIKDYVFQKCISMNSTEDIGFCLFRQVNRFGIASTLEVVDSVFVPTYVKNIVVDISISMAQIQRSNLAEKKCCLPCSSSPIKARCGSAESVVLPVPESPKNKHTSPSRPTLAEQCIGS